MYDKNPSECGQRGNILQYNKDTIRKLLELIDEFDKVAGYKIYKNLFHFYALTNCQKKKLRNYPFYNCIRKNKIPRVFL